MDFAELRLPVSDMGFQLSDMCYDAIHVKDGRFFRLSDHMDRWERSLAERRYETLGYDCDAVTDVLHGCVARAGLKDSMVTVIATRGTPETGHKDLRTCKNRLIAWALPYCSVVTEDDAPESCTVERPVRSDHVFSEAPGDRLQHRCPGALHVADDLVGVDDAPGLGHRVSIYDLKGNLVSRFGKAEEGEGPGQFIAPHGIAVDSKGDIYVSEVSYTIRGMHLTPPREMRSLSKYVLVK